MIALSRRNPSLAFGSVICALLLVSGGLAADAGAKKKRKNPAVTTYAQSAPVQADSNASVVATCPSKKTVVGGGFSSGPFDVLNEEGVLVNESRREGNGWRVSAANLGLSGSGTVVAYANCRKGAKPLTEASATVGSGCLCVPVITVVATCTDGTKPLAGGFSAPLSGADGGVFPQTSRRFGAFAWRYDGLVETDDPVEVTSYAYCGPKAATETTGVRVIESPEGEGASGTAYAQLCKRRGQRMLSGGFELAEFNILNATLQFALASNPEGGRWATKAIEAYFGPGTLQSYGYCG